MHFPAGRRPFKRLKTTDVDSDSKEVLMSKQPTVDLEIRNSEVACTAKQFAFVATAELTEGRPHSIRILADSGCSATAVAAHWVDQYREQHGSDSVRIHAFDFRYCGIDGQVRHAQGRVNLTLSTHEGKKVGLSAIVIPLSTNQDMLLGYDFYYHANLAISPKTGEARFRLPDGSWGGWKAEYTTKVSINVLEESQDLALSTVAHLREAIENHWPVCYMTSMAPYAQKMNLEPTPRPDHRHLEKANGEVPPDISQQLDALLVEYEDIFKEFSEGEPAPDRGEYNLRINLKDANTRPVRRAPYRLSPQLIEELRQIIKQFIKQGYMRPSRSPWAAPCMIIPKKQPGQYRVVWDFRALNALTIPDSHPLPRIDDLLDALAPARIFSSMDFRDGFYHIRINESDIPKTGVVTPFGHYEFLVMPMGLCNAPATFQRLVNHAFQAMIHDTNCLRVYIDDCILFTETYESQLRRLKEFFEICRNQHFRLKKEKCSFLVTRVEFLGFVVEDGCIKPLPRLVSNIAKASPPTNKTELRAFIHLVGYYQKFIPNFGETAIPLHELTGNVPYLWTDKQQKAYECLRDILNRTPGPILQLYRPELEISVQTDASDTAIGGEISQLHGDEWKPCAFFSQKLTPAQINYHTTDKETYAIVRLLEKYRCWLYGKRFPIHTDHKAVTFIQTKQVEQANQRQQRWFDLLADFLPPAYLVYKRGTANVVPDALTRINVPVTIRILHVQPHGNPALLKAAQWILPPEAQLEYTVIDPQSTHQQKLKYEYQCIERERPGLLALSSREIHRYTSESALTEEDEPLHFDLVVIHCGETLALDTISLLKFLRWPPFCVTQETKSEISQDSKHVTQGVCVQPILIPKELQPADKAYCVWANYGLYNPTVEVRIPSLPKSAVGDQDIKDWDTRAQRKGTTGTVAHHPSLSKPVLPERSFGPTSAATSVTTLGTKICDNGAFRVDFYKWILEERFRWWEGPTDPTYNKFLTDRIHPPLQRLCALTSQAQGKSVKNDIPSDHLSDIHRLIYKAMAQDHDYATRKYPVATSRTSDNLRVFKDNDHWRIVIPENRALKQRIIADCHSGPFGFHALGRRLLKLVQRGYYWQDMERDVAAYACHDCEMSKPGNHRSRHLQVEVEIRPQPVRTWQLDELTKLPLTANGNNAILTSVDVFSKFCVAIAYHDSCPAEELARMFFVHVVCRFGSPATLHTDNGPRYTSTYWQEFMIALNTHHKTGTAYHPQSQGQVERQQRTLQEALLTMGGEQTRFWDDLLPVITFAYNNSVHSATGYTPYFLLHGIEARIPNYLETTMDTTLSQRLTKLHRLHRTVYLQVLDQLRKRQHSSKRYQDRFRTAKTFEVNELVRLRVQKMGMSKLPKLTRPFAGVYRIKEVVDEAKGVYRLDLPSGHKLTSDTFNADQLERYSNQQGSVSKVIPVHHDG
ncbi:MAG: reverse transcriptase domain-containing protein, partial [Ilumatobacteraceae bacterium]